MKNPYMARAALAALGIAAAAGAPAQTATPVIAPAEPPSARIEAVPPLRPGGPAMTWQVGHWLWNGKDWAWDAGRYAEPPNLASAWEPGHWARQAAGRYGWTDGTWHS